MSKTVDALAALTMGSRWDGEPWRLDLRQNNLTVGGVPGAGKSGLLAVLLAHLATFDQVSVAMIDLKYGVEAEPWRPRLAEIADSGDAALDLLSRLLQVVEHRYLDMRSRGLRNAWTSSYFNGTTPVIVLVIDETADLFASITKEEKERAGKIATKLRRLVQVGRAAGVVVVMATQKPTADSLPTAIRDLTTLRICFKTTTAAQTDAVLGDGWRDSGINPSAFDAVTQRGYAAASTSAGLVVCRSALMTDDHIAEVVRRTSHFRRSLPNIAGEGTGDV